MKIIPEILYNALIIIPTIIISRDKTNIANEPDFINITIGWLCFSIDFEFEV